MARPFIVRRWRCVEQEIKEILAPGQDYDIANKPKLDPFIITAWLLVHDLIAYEWAKGMPDWIENGRMMWYDQSGGCHCTEPRFRHDRWAMGFMRHKIIETWLACHFYKLSDRGLTSESVNGATGGYMGASGLGFDATQYGQNAKRLDVSGYLTILDERKVISGGLTAPGQVASTAYVGTNSDCGCGNDGSHPIPYVITDEGPNRQCITP